MNLSSSAADLKLPRDIQVLLIDDDEEDRFFISRALRQGVQFEYHIVESDSLQNGFNILNSQEIDIILIDYSLGGDTGLEIFDKLLQLRLELPVIVLTGLKSQDIEDLAFTSEANDFIPKDELTPQLLDRAVRYAFRDFKNRKSLRQLAHYDQLTGLLNRHLFFDRFQQSIAHALRHGHQCALLYLDLDKFKQINDRYGHDVGDEILRNFSQRLKLSVRKVDSAARIGGDEFVVLLENIDTANAHHVAQKILQAMEDPILIHAQEFKMGVSIGVTQFPTEEISALEDVLKQADLALYAAKQAGRNTYRSYNSTMAGDVTEKALLRQDAPMAIERGEVRCLYRPIMLQASKEIIALSMHLRWYHPQCGEVDSTKAIALFDKLNLSLKFVQFFIQTLIPEVVELRRLNTSLPVLVPIPIELAGIAELEEHIDLLLTEHPWAAEQLWFGISEGCFSTLPEKHHQLLQHAQSRALSLYLNDVDGFCSPWRYLALPCVKAIKIANGFKAAAQTNVTDSHVLGQFVQYYGAENKYIFADFTHDSVEPSLQPWTDIASQLPPLTYDEVCACIQKEP